MTLLKRITNPTAIPVSVNTPMIQGVNPGLSPEFPAVVARANSEYRGDFHHHNQNKTGRNPNCTAGSDNNNMVLARGWSMFYSYAGSDT